MIITYVNNKSSSFRSTGVGYTRVLKPGPARQVDPGPGRPGWRQKPAWELAWGNPVHPGPGPPGQTRVRHDQFFFILIVIKRRRFGLLKGQHAED